MFDPVQRHEQGGIRPAVVIPNDAFNQTPDSLCFFVPVTRTDRGLPSLIVVEPSEGGSPKRSFIVCEMAKSLNISRLRRRMGIIEAGTLERVQARVGMFIDR